MVQFTLSNNFSELDLLECRYVGGGGWVDNFFYKMISILDDHARGLSTFTVMAGLGGFMGYSLGGINWDATFIGKK